MAGKERKRPRQKKKERERVLHVQGTGSPTS